MRDLWADEPHDDEPRDDYAQALAEDGYSLPQQRRITASSQPRALTTDGAR